MSDWTSGYVGDFDYTFGYYTELNPLRIKLAFLYNGLVCPDVGTACELGFGQGVTANLHAAASITQWCGTDFNPSQAAFAQEIAGIAGAGARLLDDTFADFASRTDLPDFDFIGLHGIWSWITDENRAVLVAFIRRKLKVGGVVFVSYNTMPGWAAFAPMRHMLVQHAEVMSPEGNSLLSRADSALDFADRLMATDPRFARANPDVADRLKKLKGRNRRYLVHEFFNGNWHPMHFSSMAGWLEPAKLQYGCSADFTNHLDTVNLTPEQRDFLKEIPDVVFRESVRDFMVNCQFRRDYWVKGVRRLPTLEQALALRAQAVVLTTHRADVSLTFSTGLGKVTVGGAALSPVLDLLADHKPRTLGQIEDGLQGRDIAFAQILDAVLLFTGAGDLALVQDENAILKVQKNTATLNTHLLAKAQGSGDVAYLASPVTGGGVQVGRVRQLFLLALRSGKTQPAEWAKAAWGILELQGQKLIKDGKAIESAEENLAQLTSQAQDFALKQLPVLKALKIVLD